MGDMEAEEPDHVVRPHGRAATRAVPDPELPQVRPVGKPGVSAGVAGSAINIRANELASIGKDLDPRRAPNARAACPGRQPADEKPPCAGAGCGTR